MAHPARDRALQKALESFSIGLPGAGPRAGAALDQALSGPEPVRTLRALRHTVELAGALPDIAAMSGFDQRSPYHPEGDLYLHTEQVMARISTLSDDPDLRWAALYHDTGKPESLWVDDAGVGHYYAHPERGNEDHEVISARICARDLERLGLPAERRERICALVAHHMRARFSSVRGARRFIGTVGAELAESLLLLREADFEGNGDAHVQVERMRDLCRRASEVPPDERRRLSLSGGELMRHLEMTPGPAVGDLLAYLANEIAAGRLADEPSALLSAARTAR